MAKTKLPYDVKNNLDSYLNRAVGVKMAMQGIKVNKKEIMNEIAIYCGVGYENINRIKSNTAQPSLGVAMKIAEYFEAKVEDIFKIR